MKLVWASVVLAPVLLLLPVVVQGQTCPGGIPGLNAKDIVCCPLECGKCAGKGCSQREGGASACCGGGIKASQGLCSDTGTAPCNLVDPNPTQTDQTCSNGLPGYEASDVCCPLSCGRCGGSGCSKRGEGCCTSKVKDAGKKCSVTKAAPCNIDGDVDVTHEKSTEDSSEDVDSRNDSDQTCSNGLPGYEASNVCCPLSCGRCGGSGCSKRGEGCCTSKVKDAGKKCSVTKAAPCNIDGDVDSKKDSDRDSDSDSADGFTGGDYGKEFSGDATYYGYTTAGNCAYRSDIPGMYDGMIPVALNSPQYGDSLMCGACIEATSKGKGSGNNPPPSSFKAFVTDKCPECKWGDLDLSMSGDGRWDVEWEFVPCPGESISFEFEGSNAWYWKIQPRGTKTPVVSLTINGKAASRSQDNFFVLGGGPWYGAQTVVTTTVDGTVKTSQVTR